MIAEPVLRLATSVVSRGGEHARLTTFIFHRVPARPDPLLPEEPDARTFDRILGWIGAQFRVLDPTEACERLARAALPQRAAIVTFDDGYRDNAEVALPLLQSHGMRAAFFVATGFLNGGTMFNDRVIEAVRGARGDALDADAAGLALGRLPLDGTDARRAAIARLLGAVKHLAPAQRLAAVERIEAACGACAPDDLMMTDAHVKALHDAGMTIGGHTRTHPILRVLDDAEAAREIADGARDLRDLTGCAPELFAYPNGRPGQDFDARHPPMVAAAGFRFAFTTQPGVAVGGSDPLRLPRFTPWDRSALRFGARLLRNLLVPVTT